MNFLNVLELFRIKRIDYSFLGLGVISQSLPISPWHANPQRFEFRTAACCLYWIGGGCHQIPSCHSDELGMTDQKLVFARVDRLTPIPSRQQQQQQSKVTAQEFCLVYYLSLNFWDWNKLWFHAEVSQPLWCVCTYVRLWYPRSFCQSDVICTTAHQEWRELLGGFIFLFRQLVGLLRQPWRKKFNLTGEIK